MNEIIGKFAREGILIEDNAYFRLREMEDPVTVSSELIVKIKSNGAKFTVLTSEMLDEFFEIDNPSEIKARGPLMVPEEREFDFKVISDTSNRSYTSGEIGDMIAYFNSRYNRLKSLLSKRSELKGHIPIADLRGGDDVISIIGMVNDVRSTKNNHRIIELEDDTGEISVVVHNENHRLFERSEKLVRDEVVGVQGTKKGRFVVASEIFHPGVPRIQEKEMDFSVAFISDVHIGSQTFLEDAFMKFVKWINGDFGSEEQRSLAADVRYLVVAGDIVDGIGIYPGQEKELLIKDIHEQYEEAARLFGDIRSDIKIIMIPGNHDASRIAEPQPAIPEEYAKSLYSIRNIEFLSNPSLVSLDGVRTLIYHGRSFDDMAMSVNGLSHERSDLIMEELLEKRHLAPIYGERTPLASEIEDHLVIEDVPHILHTGHVHINAYRKYKGVHLINSGTFQSQTEFQKIYNIVPTCGQVPVLNRGVMKLLEFN
ncbi:DNA-directed DNA polymerase II small subunit [Methanothermobacter thermautotrophicus]|uniref:DNA polymerase II small subunit n=1 Tax=Methanothermobacter thermautotrophicus TaxID=145262 RepID=A0A842YKY8_METTF|nr:DNA-directed DNA polymerase II small subunit [Methanothermobacter thermautotrophicus]MBE2900016.1 DNA-directed DNA polymerase II small subunit [Methanothermobacter thermautotrophicus]MCQ8905814.1 DNA-directed DNA polymerase II small subunit [Methanothermobacter sp.]